jgi:hypothetical protein
MVGADKAPSRSKVNKPSGVRHGRRVGKLRGRSPGKPRFRLEAKWKGTEGQGAPDPLGLWPECGAHSRGPGAGVGGARWSWEAARGLALKVPRRAIVGSDPGRLSILEKGRESIFFFFFKGAEWGKEGNGDSPRMGTHFGQRQRIAPK